MSQLRMRTEPIVPSWISGIQRQLVEFGEDQEAATIHQAIEQYRGQRLTLAVLGKAKRGKSTLLNALLGRRDDLVAPVDRLPASNAITRFHWAKQDSALVVFRDGRQLSISYPQIRDFVTEEGNRENRKQVDVVHVSGPFSGQDQFTELVDTPGAGSIHEHHDALLQAFIPQADAVLFLVTARMPLDQDELELLRSVQAADIQKIFFVINRIDETEPQDLNDAIRHNQALLAQHGIPVSSFYPISAKQAFQGNLDRSGVPQLIQAIQNFVIEQKQPLFESRLDSRVRQAITPVLQRYLLRITTARKGQSEIDAELQKLQSRKLTLEQERQFSTQEFQLAWKRACDEFEAELSTIESIAGNEVRQKVTTLSLLGIGRASRQLSTLVNEIVDRHLSPSRHEFEAKLSQAANRLRTTFPTCSITSLDSGGVSVQSNGFLATTVGGLALAGTGVGLASAGAATAATIAAANAAALAATTTVAVPTAMGGLMGSIPIVGGMLTQMATGTATLATPAAITATPLWVALSGPVGWSLAGIGMLAIPFAWRSSQLKVKDQLETASRQQVQHVFAHLLKQRLPALRQMASSIVDEFQLRLDRQIDELQHELQRCRDHRPSVEELNTIKQHYDSLTRAIPVNS